MNQSEMSDTAEWADVMVDATRRFSDRTERAKVVAKMRGNAVAERQTMLLHHLDDCTNQLELWEEKEE